uniref:Uncharacterized protein n=1 Tax=Amorphochlora amoebiformis TaxID=1561963 RepID=A0A7S0DF12_9EUKA|mmetsp:Transcript_25505/g.40266  ORF Transcript_25505/g.40266 Transcript_25505/m.40266 type:complete len:387 (+) Transcript_25505:249-1409(+)
MRTSLWRIICLELVGVPINATLYIVEPAKKISYNFRSVFDTDEGEIRDCLPKRALNKQEMLDAWKSGLENKYKLPLHGNLSGLLRDEIKKAVSKEMEDNKIIGCLEAQEELQSFLAGWDDDNVSDVDRNALLYGMARIEIEKAIDRVIQIHRARYSRRKGNEVKDGGRVMSTYGGFVKLLKECRMDRFTYPVHTYEINTKLMFQKLDEASMVIKKGIRSIEPKYVALQRERELRQKYPFVMFIREEFTDGWEVVLNDFKRITVRYARRDSTRSLHFYEARVKVKHMEDRSLVPRGMRLLDRDDYEKVNDTLRQIMNALREKSKIHIFLEPTTHEYRKQMRRAMGVEDLFRRSLDLKAKGYFEEENEPGQSSLVNPNHTQTLTPPQP